ncbi:hypothetical protein SAMN05518847_102399 [Paenibacillus sp. OV219]|nr:hypothetical protein SAMN05518847_102399 [Paenibacillus sp. OV219]
MVSAVMGVFIGWLLALIGLDTFLHNTVGLDHQGYYICWFASGVIGVLINRFKGSVTK